MGSTVVRDPIHGLILLHPEEWKVIDTLAFQRLRGIQQLAMTHLVYPGARHSRFEHCIGAAHVAGRLAEAIGLSRDDIRTRRMRMAALVHDLGHGPFSHVTEEIFEKRTNGKSGHENISAAIVRHDPQVRKAMGVQMAKWVSDLLGKRGHGAIRSFERDVVAGPADADKMDYLLRDSHYCGVKYGEYDLDKIVEVAREVTPALGKQVFLGFSEQGVFPLEEMLLARYHMHRQVYGHKTRVATDRMLVRSIDLAIVEGILPEDLFTPTESPNASFVQDFVKYDDATVIKLILANSSSKSAEVMEALMDRRLVKRVLEYDFPYLEQTFGQPEAGYIAWPSDPKVLPTNLPAAEKIVADAIGVEAHWVSLYWKELVSPISRPFAFNVAGKGIMIQDSKSGLGREFNEVSQVFQEWDLPAQMRITLYAKLPSGETMSKMNKDRKKQIEDAMRNALELVGQASAAS